MTATVEPTVQWSQDQMVEVTLNEPDDFLKVRETLTRIGVASRKEKKLYQSCHILHKQGRYYIVHSSRREAFIRIRSELCIRIGRLTEIN